MYYNYFIHVIKVNIPILYVWNMYNYFTHVIKVYIPILYVKYVLQLFYTCNKDAWITCVIHQKHHTWHISKYIFTLSGYASSILILYYLLWEWTYVINLDSFDLLNKFPFNNSFPFLLFSSCILLFYLSKKMILYLFFISSTICMSFYSRNR